VGDQVRDVVFELVDVVDVAAASGAGAMATEIRREDLGRSRLGDGVRDAREVSAVGARAVEQDQLGRRVCRIVAVS
jgi:hypothetical protein